MQKEEHLSFDTIEKLVEGKLKEDELSDVEEHITICAECSRKIHTLQDFSSLWNKWTAKAHGDAYRKADKKRLAAVHKKLTERKVEALMAKISDLIGKSPAHLQKTLEVIGQNLHDLLRKTFTYPTPCFAPVFGEYQANVLSPFGKVRYPIRFEWQPYEKAEEYKISIEETGWASTKTKIEIDPGELKLAYGSEYMWELKVMRGDEIIEEENGFFSLPTERELREIEEIDNQLREIPGEEEKFILWGGILEEKELYMEAIENYNQAYAINRSFGTAYRIASCYDKCELEELRDEWNKKIIQQE